MEFSLKAYVMRLSKIRIEAKILAGSCLLAWTAMATATPVLPPAPIAATLYARLGGEESIVQIVDVTINLVATNPKTARSFDKVNLANVKKKIVEHLCALADGPCKYTGDAMHLVHRGMDITEGEFYGMVEALRFALDRAHVNEAAKNELLRILAPMKRDIVTK